MEHHRRNPAGNRTIGDRITVAVGDSTEDRAHPAPAAAPARTGIRANARAGIPTDPGVNMRADARTAAPATAPAAAPAHRQRLIARLEATRRRREAERTRWELRAAKGTPEAPHFVRLKSLEIETLDKRLALLRRSASAAAVRFSGGDAESGRAR